METIGLANLLVVSELAYVFHECRYNVWLRLEVRIRQHRRTQPDGLSAIHDGPGDFLVSDRVLPVGVAKIGRLRIQIRRAWALAVAVLAMTRRASLAKHRFRLG